MKNFRALVAGLIGGVLALLPSPATVSRKEAQASRPDLKRVPVIVELFTSEGCSSCPPADKLLQKLQEEQPVERAEIIALEEHVDYWNHDGWSDPYSSSEFTNRQEQYGIALNEPQAYTPEMIVDGQTAFVGSDARKAELEIGKAAREAKTDVTIAAASRDMKGSQRFSISVGNLAGHQAADVAEVWLAVTEDGLRSSVSRGENAGNVLLHTATLRSLHKLGVADPNGMPASFSGKPTVKLDLHWNPERLRVTAFIQAQKSRKILGAASAKIPH